MADVRRLALNLATLREQCGFGEAVALCARFGIHAVAPWVDQLQRFGLREAVRMLRDCGMEVTSYCRGGMFTASTAQERRQRIEDNRRRIEEAAMLGAGCLLLVCGGLPPQSRDLEGARHMVEDGIAAIIDDAAGAGVRLAIEPLHPMYAAEGSVVATLEQALDICDAFGPGAPIGVMVDVYHCWWDPGLERQIARAGRERLLGFQISDWLVPTRGRPFDRGMPGEGVIDIPRIRSRLEEAGYEGFHELEVLSAERWWRRDPVEVLRAAVERHALFC